VHAAGGELAVGGEGGGSLADRDLLRVFGSALSGLGPHFFRQEVTPYPPYTQHTLRVVKKWWDDTVASTTGIAPVGVRDRDGGGGGRERWTEIFLASSAGLWPGLARVVSIR